MEQCFSEKEPICLLLVYSFARASGSTAPFHASCSKREYTSKRINKRMAPLLVRCKAIFFTPADSGVSQLSNMPCVASGALKF